MSLTYNQFLDKRSKEFNKSKSYLEALYNVIIRNLNYNYFSFLM